MPANESLVMVTPSFRGDFHRCRLLCESVDRFVPESVKHLLVVDRRDQKLFRPLANGRRELLEAEQLLPEGVFRVPLVRNPWFTTWGTPIRNWIVQQILKLGTARNVPASQLMFVDSDVFFVNPWNESNFLQQGALRLFQVPLAAPNAQRSLWEQRAAELLGLAAPAPQSSGTNFVGNMITWHTAQVKTLLQQIERLHGKPWHRMIGESKHFSEYTLYGRFIEESVGVEKAGHFASASPLCLERWDSAVPLSDADLDAFFRTIEPSHQAAMISAKISLGLDTLEQKLRERFAR